jgi:hypothetical protein
VDSKKLLLIGVLVAFAAALLFRYLSTRAEGGSDEESPVVDAPNRPTPHPSPVQRAAEAEGEDGTELGASKEESVMDGYEDHPSIRQYRTITRYPTSTRPLTTQSTDLLQPNKRHERRQPVPDAKNAEDRAWEVLYTADRYFVRGEETVTVSLALWHEGEPVIPTGVMMVASRRGASGAGDEAVLSVERVDSELRASLAPNEHWPEYIGELEVTATFGAPGLRQQTGRLRFFFTGAARIPARFTGRFSDDTRNGDLTIDVSVDAETPGTYRIEGNLFDRENRPVAWARAETDLLPGMSDVTLVFYGLAFHDAGAVAPFTLRALRGHRLRRGDAPHREDMPTYDGEYETSARYSLADFRSEEYQSPHKERMLERYRDAIERGVVLTEPEFVGDGRQR